MHSSTIAQSLKIAGLVMIGLVIAFLQPGGKPPSSAALLVDSTSEFLVRHHGHLP